MKNVFRTALCAAVMTAAVCVPTFAVKADAPVPAKQGDFYVLANDQYVTFTDAVPQIRDSRSYLPMATVFDQLGFKDIQWNDAQRSVTASKDGVTVKLVIGSPSIALTKDGKTTTITTDVAPYIDAATSRTYVPFGLVADALGCRCGSCFHVIWNQEREAAGLDQDMSEDTSSSVKVAVEALKLIIRRDHELAALPNHEQKLLDK